jgi:hypothetical protein
LGPTIARVAKVEQVEGPIKGYKDFNIV